MQGSIIRWIGCAYTRLLIAVFVLIAPRAGAYGSEPAYPFVYSAERYRVHDGDFNGDGRRDLLLQPRNSADPVQIRLAAKALDGPELPHFSSPHSVGVDWANSQLWVLDLDGDGMDDLALLPSDKSRFVVLRNSGNLNQPARHPFAFSQAERIAVDGVNWEDYRLHNGDFDGDGSADFLLQPKRFGAPVLVVADLARQARKHTFPHLEQHLQRFNHSLRVATWHIGDFDGDGSDDILVQANRRGHAHVVMMSRLTTAGGSMVALPLELPLPAHAGMSRMWVSDFDRNGLADITLRSTVGFDQDGKVQTQYNYLLNTGRARSEEHAPEFWPCTHPLGPGSAMPRCIDSAREDIDFALQSSPQQCWATKAIGACPIRIRAYARHQAMPELESCVHDLSEHPVPLVGVNDLACGPALDMTLELPPGQTSFALTVMGLEIQRQTVTVVGEHLAQQPSGSFHTLPPPKMRPDSD